MRLIYITIIVPVCILIPIIAGLWRYKRLPDYGRLLLWYLLMAGIVNAMASAMASRRINNMPLLHIYTVAEFVLLAIFYKKLLEGNIRNFINWAIALFIGLAVMYATWPGGIHAYNQVPRTLESIAIGTLAIIFFFRQLHPEKKRPEAASWMNAGLLLYFSGSFFLFLFFEVIAKARSLNVLAWTLHATLVLLMYLLFTIAFLRAGKQ